MSESTRGMLCLLIYIHNMIYIISVSNMLDKSSTLPSLLRSINDFESAVIVPHITFFATCAPFEYNAT